MSALPPAANAPLAVASAMAFVFGLVLLFTCMILWLRRRRRALVVRLPLVGRHEIELPSAGAYVIDLERPIYRRSKYMLHLPGAIIGGPRVTLREAATGAEVMLHAPVLGAETKGWTRLRKSMRTFAVTRGGRYVLDGEDVGTSEQWPEHEMIIARSGGLTSTLLGLGMAAGGLLAAAGVVVAILALSGLRFEMPRLPPPR